MKLSKVVAVLGATLVLASSIPAAPKNPKAENPLPSCPPDWKVEVIAEVPDILHPSVVCVTPDGRVLVGQDPMDQSPEGIKPIDSILCYHPDGRVTVWATNLYAVFGLAYYDGKVYVHEYPKLTVFTDSGDIGTNPQEMFTTHPKPIGGLNDHIPANLRLAMDGYFYMDTGDKGIYGAVGKDGSRVDLLGGGIMRFRPGGTELEIYANGTRNHLDIAINWEDEMFTYDNTDDGNGWWTRVTHMVDRGWYGYPFDYKPRRPYTLWMMQDYGGGSPTGAICYNEDALPEEYHGSLFMSEWGKGELDRFVVERDGASYKIAKREVFMKKQGKEFRPLGIDITPDGMGFYVADWNYGGWMSRGSLAGRFLKVTYNGPNRAAAKPSWYVPAAMGKSVTASLNELLAGLKHPSQRVRLVGQRRVAEKGKSAVPALTKMLKDSALPPYARASALWTLDAIDGGKSARAAVLAAASDKDISLRAQAIRQLGTRKAQEAITSLIKSLKDESPVIRLRAATALGRIADLKAVSPLLKALGEKDFFTRYSIFTALNYIGRAQPAAWKEIAQALENNETELRDTALFAMRETFDIANAEALANFVKDPARCSECRAAAVPVLAELHHKRPAWNGNWWATQPVKSPPPAKTVEWEGTPLVFAAVRDALKDPSLEVRLAAIEAVEITRDQQSAGVLVAMFEKETQNDFRSSIVKSLAATKAPEATTLLLSVLNQSSKYKGILVDAVTAAEKLGGREIVEALNALAGQGNDAALQTEILAALGALKSKDSIPVLQRFATAPDTNLSTTAIASVAKIGGDAAFNALAPLLEDNQLIVRRSAITALGSIKNKSATPLLMAAYEKPETRSDALLALSHAPDVRALDIYLRTLDDRNGTIRDASRRAIEGIRRQARPEIEAALQSGKTLSAAALATLQKIYNEDEKAREGPIFRNQIDLKSTEPSVFAAFAASTPGNAAHGKAVFNDLKGLACIKCHKVNGQGGEVGPDLTSVGAKYNRAQIIESILYPSKLILDGYQQTIVFTKDGDSQAGILRSETADELTLVDTEGKKHVIAKKQIEVRKSSELSLMPDGMQLGLSKQDFSDLVSYVEGLKDKPAAAK